MSLKTKCVERFKTKWSDVILLPLFPIPLSTEHLNERAVSNSRHCKIFTTCALLKIYNKIRAFPKLKNKFMCLTSIRKIHTSFFLISNSVQISPPSVKMRTGLWGYMYRIIPCTALQVVKLLHRRQRLPLYQLSPLWDTLSKAPKDW